MSQLLIKEAFDGLFLSEAVIKTANSYTTSGELNKDFFSEEEWNELPEKSYSRWSSIKPFCFRLSFDAFAKDFLFSHGMDFEEVWTRQFMIFLELAQMHWFCGLPPFLLALKMNEC